MSAECNTRITDVSGIVTASSQGLSGELPLPGSTGSPRGERSAALERCVADLGVGCWRLGAAGLQRAEVAPVEGRELRLVEPFGDGEDGGVDEADVGVGVAVAAFADTTVVGGHEVFDLERAGGDVVEEREPSAGAETALRPVLDLDEDGCGHDERLVGGFEQVAARAVVGDTERATVYAATRAGAQWAYSYSRPRRWS